MKRSPIIFISAAEASGDEHAANLIAAIRRAIPHARFVGAAGPKMAAEGCEVLADLTRQAAMLGGPMLRPYYYWKQTQKLKQAIRQIKPDIHIPVDSPALNWHLSAQAKKIGCPVMYYIAPQVWAWAPWRVEKLIRLTNHVACILPFEQKYFRDRGVNATYVGHPSLDSLPPRPEPMPDLVGAWAEGNWQVALLPGSRPSEITKQSRALLAVSKEIRRRWPKSRCIFAAGNNDSAELIRKSLLPEDRNLVEITVDQTHQVLANSHFAIAKSGTVTLEVAYFGVPMVIFYHVWRLGYKLVGKWLIQTPHLSLVNILSGRKIVPELMPWYGKIGPLKDMVLEVMNDLGYLFEVRQTLLDLVNPLRQPGRASDNAARIVVDILEGKTQASTQGASQAAAQKG